MRPVLHMLCGKIASGKSTLAGQLAQAPDTLSLSQDDWLFHLYGDQMRTAADYVRCADRLNTVLGPHLIQILRTGLSVVLDFPANTVAQRAWMRQVFEAAGADHRLHLLEHPDLVLLDRLAARQDAGTHPFTVTEALFHSISKHFQPPTAEEGFHIITYAGQTAAAEPHD